MSFAEMKTLESELVRLEKAFTKESDLTTKRSIADQILTHCRRVRDLEKRAIISNKIRVEEWIPKYTPKVEVGSIEPYATQVTVLAGQPFSPEAYPTKKSKIENLMQDIITARAAAPKPDIFTPVLAKIWEVSVKEDDAFEDHRRLNR